MNLKCILFGHLLKKTYKGYLCDRCFKDTDYTPISYSIQRISILLTFSFLFFVLFMLSKGLVISVSSCCGSMYPESNQGNYVDGYKPCYYLEEKINDSSILQIGDIVTYRYLRNEPFSHRINGTCNLVYKTENFVSINNMTSEIDYNITILETEEGFKIQGDNPSSVKDCVPKWAIYARQKYKLLCIADLIGEKPL